MKITDVRKKVVKLKDLLSEYSTISAIIKHIEKDTTLYDEKYYTNLKKRQEDITKQFDLILK